MVTTGKDKKHATKNAVSMVVYGLKGKTSNKSEEILLEKAENNATCFQAGASDEFKVLCIL